MDNHDHDHHAQHDDDQHHQHDQHDADQGIGGHLAGQEVSAEQPVKASDTREVKLKIEQLGGGKDTAISITVSFAQSHRHQSHCHQFCSTGISCSSFII